MIHLFVVPGADPINPDPMLMKALKHATTDSGVQFTVQSCALTPSASHSCDSDLGVQVSCVNRCSTR